MDAWKRIRALSPAAQPIVTAALSVYLLLTVLLAWITICGTSTLATAAWCLAMTAGTALAPRLQRLVPRPRTLIGTAAILTSLFVLTAPSALDLCLSLSVSTGLPEIGIWLLAALPVLAAAVSSGLLMQTPREAATGRRLSGIVVGAALFAAHAWLSLPFVAAAGLLAVLTIGLQLLEQPDGTGLATAVRSPRRPFHYQQQLLSFAAGMGVIAGGMVLNRVFAVSMLGLATGLMLTSAVLLVATWPLLRLTRRPWVVWTVCMGVLAALPWFYTSVLQWNLQFRAAATSGFSIVLFQAFQLTVWIVPVVLAAIAGCGVLSDTQRPGDGLRIPMSFAGAAVALSFVMAGISLVWLVLGAVVVLAAIPAVLLWQVPAVSRRFQSVRVGGTVAAVAAIASVAVCPPDLAAPSHLLFTARSVAAIQRGVRPDMIPETDATRLISRQETADGTITTWKTQADRYEFRINGHQIGAISTDPRTTPQPPAEVLTCVLPMVLHPQAGSVLLLDDFSGVALRICEEFPVHRVVLAESRNTDVTQKLMHRPQDDRVEVVTAAGEIVVRNRAMKPVDVVVSMLADPKRSASLSRLSTSWYRAVSRRLNADGIFCQRIRQESVDRVTIEHLLGRATAVFDQVALVQLVPGEVALVGSNSETPLLDEGVLSRMERQHVRRQLGACGWDWCQLAALAIVDSNDPVGLWIHETLPEPGGAASGTPGLRLGWQTVRPDSQYLGIWQLVSPHQVRIAEAVPAGPAHDEFRRRISAYAQQLEVLTAFPDEPWIYRKSLKSEMQRNQRRPVEEFRDGEIHRRIHPLDQHRKEYVQAIGTLLKQISAGKLSAGDLLHLNSFSEDYEPLISDFAHYELVRIHEMADHPLPASEFQHRLHTVYFSQPGEYSIRNVVGALEQLTRQPEVVNSDVERFDHLNTLIQHLIVRWESRTHFEPKSAVRMQRDVELSVQAVQKALIQMEQLTDAVGMTRSEFLLRRQFVTEALIGPLREYKEHVLAHRATTEPSLIYDERPDSEAVDDGMLRMLMESPATN